MSLIRSVAKKVFSEMGSSSLSYKVGTMIETPRAALVADEVYYVEMFLPGFYKYFLSHREVSMRKDIIFSSFFEAWKTL